MIASDMAIIAVTVMECIMALEPPIVIAPKTATPIAPAVCLMVFRAAEAVADRALLALASTPLVMAGTAKPIPTGIIKNGKHNCQYGVVVPAIKRPEKPAANKTKPATIGSLIPNLFIILPLTRLDITKPAVNGRKARPAVSEG